jgi:hypothetical protein
VQVIASQITAFGQINACLAGSLDWPAYAAAQLASSKQNFLAHLAEPLVDDPRIHHVRYPDFVRDPVGVVRDFYERCEVAWTAAADAAMREYLAGNRSDRYGRFEYSTDVLGVDVEELHRELAPYRERFGLEIETRA